MGVLKPNSNGQIAIPKRKIDEDLVNQIKRSLEDLKDGRVRRIA